MLEELIKSHESGKEKKIIRKLPLPRAKNVIKKAYYLNFYSTDEEAKFLCERCLENLHGKSPDLDKAIDYLNNNRTKIECFYLETTSEKFGMGLDIYNNYIELALLRQGFKEDKLLLLPHGFNEIYDNCIIHGNLAAPISEYIKREKLNVFKAKDEKGINEEIRQNQQRKIIVEVCINKKVMIARLIDEGKGFDQSCILEDPNKQCLTYGRGLMIAQDERPGEIQNQLFHERIGEQFHTLLIKYNN
jgi:hypothetical protein